jgi:hypothetical protein
MIELTQKSKPAVQTTAQSLGALPKSARDIMRKDKGLNGDLGRFRGWAALWRPSRPYLFVRTGTWAFSPGCHIAGFQPGVHAAHYPRTGIGVCDPSGEFCAWHRSRGFRVNHPSPHGSGLKARHVIVRPEGPGHRHPNIFQVL